MPKRKEPEYLNAIQAAEYVGTTRQRIYELAQSGRLGRKVANFWLFTPEELDEFKASPRRPGRPRKQGQEGEQPGNKTSPVLAAA
jgi:hypothetical protein